MATVLFIEDNLEIRENVVEFLELSGYRALAADGGATGIELAKEKKPDVILCDIMMPETNGYQVFEQLRKNDATSSIPFIFVTASVEKKEIKAGLDMGAFDYIRKPFEPEELLTAINRCLHAR